MPHSSGGGSRSGGSFSGSSSSFGSSGSSGNSVSRGPRISNEYRPGYHRYVYYHNNMPMYFYSSRDITERDTRLNKGGLIMRGAMILVGIILLVIFAGSWFHSPQKLPLNYDTEIRILDQADVLSDSDEALLQNTFTEFQTETGITPALLTVMPDDWQSHYNDFSRFAYESYVNLFTDESHWLFCYSGDPSSEFDDWQWEGMQGNDTDHVLTEKQTDAFNENVQKYLYARNRYTVGEAFSQGLQELMPEAMKPSFQPNTDDAFSVLAFLFVLVIGPALNIVSEFKNVRAMQGKAGAVRCPTDEGSVKEDTCAYCGGIYVHGLHLQCPHCGAPAQASPNA